MLQYHDLCKNISPCPVPPEASVGCYAWLEQSKGAWHFLTNLFADVHESTRSWASKEGALDELAKEGWTVVGCYPDNHSMTQASCEESMGYGLVWTGC